MTLTKDDLEWLDRIGVDDRRMKIIKKNLEVAEGRGMRLSLLAEMLETNVEELGNECLRLKKTSDKLKKLCYDNRNINGLLDLESFHGEVQRMVSTKEGREELAKYDVTADSW